MENIYGEFIGRMYMDNDEYMSQYASCLQRQIFQLHFLFIRSVTH